MCKFIYPGEDRFWAFWSKLINICVYLNEDEDSNYLSNY